MTYAIKKYKEPLRYDEIAFLEEKELRDRKVYFVVYRILMVMSFLLPFIGSWYRAYEGAPNAFSYVRFFVSATILLGISSIATYASYRAYHRKLRMDIRERTKTIETNRITKKLYVKAKNAYYFYIDSTTKLSIEVSEAYYNSMKEGDEVSMEYTTHSKLYLGYF